MYPYVLGGTQGRTSVLAGGSVDSAQQTSSESALSPVGLPARHDSVADRLGFEVEQLTAELSLRESELERLRARLEAVEYNETELRQQESQRLMELRRTQSQKLESLGVLAGGVAHEFNNLLMSILGHADLARSSLPPKGLATGSIEKISRAAHRAAELAHQMLAFSGKGSFLVGPSDLSSLVRGMVPSIEAMFSGQERLELQLADPLPKIEADVDQLRQAVSSLVINAVESLSKEKGSVTISTGALQSSRSALSPNYLAEGTAEGPYVFLDVVDSGCGMDSETAAKIFEPFFSTKFTGRGLGLAATWGIVRGHKGALRVETAPSRGTTVRLLFPVSRTAA